MHNHFCHTVCILALCLLLMSCGPAPQGERLPIPSATRSQSTSTSSATRASSATGTLPAAAAIDVTRKPPLKVLFRMDHDIKRLEDLYVTTRVTTGGKIHNLSVVSNCNLEVLKVFVATDWTPVILSGRSSKGHLSAVMGYDDAEQQIQIGNPLGVRRKGGEPRGGRMLTYSDFEKEWATGSGRTCVLVTPKKLDESEIYAALKKYLPEEQVAQIRVRSR